MRVIIELELSVDPEPETGARLSGNTEAAVREAVYDYLGELMEDDSLEYTIK